MSCPSLPRPAAAPSSGDDSELSAVLAAYATALGRPWTVAEAGERVWMFVYPPSLEQTMRSRLPEIAATTRAAGRTWAKIDVTNAFGDWLLGTGAAAPRRTALGTAASGAGAVDAGGAAGTGLRAGSGRTGVSARTEAPAGTGVPAEVAAAAVPAEQDAGEMFAVFEQHVAERIRTGLRSRRVGAQTVVALVGLAALHPFVSAGRLLSAVEDEVRGRLLVLFPGSFDEQTRRYHLLCTPDGFARTALPVLPNRRPRRR